MINKFFKFLKSRERGSALLIVLGFLSFMMISAVSFAVYMRISRQATSNYRHATSSRRMLEAALYRSIDDVDYFLRYGYTQESADFEKRFNPKFPLFELDDPGDPCRVLTSVTDGSDQNSDARVLTLDSLGYIPAYLVNHVRNYATSANNSAQWRSVSMPWMGMSVSDPQSSYGEAVVGRYAYACINVSDMLDVNLCNSLARGVGSNQVSIAHLFENNSDRENFYNNLKNTDIYYNNLADFYACMYGRGDQTFGSPFHEYLDSMDPGNDPFRGTTVSKNVLITDTETRAEPVSEDACYFTGTHPITPAHYVTAQPPDDIKFADDKFRVALGNAILDNGGNPTPIDNNNHNILAACLADYLDEDCIPKALNIPPVDMAPMVCQVSVPQNPMIIVNTRPGGQNADGDPILIYGLDLTRLVNLPMNVKVMWPFKNSSSYEGPTPSFTVEVTAYLKIHRNNDAQLNTASFMRNLPQHEDYIIAFTGTMPVPNFWGSNYTDNDDTCANVPLTLTPTFNTPENRPFFDMIDSEDVTYNGFASGNKPGLSFVIGQVRIVIDGGETVDAVPTMVKFPGANGISVDEEFKATQKLFFQTQLNQGPTVAKNMPSGTAIAPYEWSCLETPDPRFNWNTSNWLQTPGGVITPGLNESTEWVLGADGRDNDVFISISNGNQMYSVGELGFLPRPFNYNVVGAPVDFRVNIADDENKLKDYCYDYSAMYRSIRLYDHGTAYRRDKIYDYFTVADADGTLPGPRVNPFTDIPQVLEAAIERIPFNYGIASAISEAIAAGDVPSDELLDANYSEEYTTKWDKLVDEWKRRVAIVLNGKQNNPYGGGDVEIRKEFTHSLRTLYPAHEFFPWYDEDQERIFNTSFNIPLHEIDRKMLYAYTLDSFSDAQQLFLYFINAEATAAAFGARTRSVSGGRIVALVWRNPYPHKFDLGPAGNTRSEPNENEKKNYFHEHRVLFVKQLGK